jgi:hypothetical protein
MIAPTRRMIASRYRASPHLIFGKHVRLMKTEMAGETPPGDERPFGGD